MQIPKLKRSFFCWICGKAVDLKTCSTDEHGVAVHEECYVLKMALALESMRLSVRKPPHRTAWFTKSDLRSRASRSAN